MRHIRRKLRSRGGRFARGVSLSCGLARRSGCMFGIIFHGDICSTPYLGRSGGLCSTTSTSGCVFSELGGGRSDCAPSLSLCCRHALPGGRVLAVDIANALVRASGGELCRRCAPRTRSLTVVRASIAKGGHSVVNRTVCSGHFGFLMFDTKLHRCRVCTEGRCTNSSPIMSRVGRTGATTFTRIRNGVEGIDCNIDTKLAHSCFGRKKRRRACCAFAPAIHLGFSPRGGNGVGCQFGIRPGVPSLDTLAGIRRTVSAVRVMHNGPTLRACDIFGGALGCSCVGGGFIFVLGIARNCRGGVVVRDIFTRKSGLISVGRGRHSTRFLHFNPSFAFHKLGVNDLGGFLALDVSNKFAHC